MKSIDEMLDFIGEALDAFDIPIISSCYKVGKSGAAVIAKEENTKTSKLKKEIHDDLKKMCDANPHMKENIKLALKAFQDFYAEGKSLIEYYDNQEEIIRYVVMHSNADKDIVKELIRIIYKHFTELITEEEWREFINNHLDDFQKAKETIISGINNLLQLIYIIQNESSINHLSEYEKKLIKYRILTRIQNKAKDRNYDKYKSVIETHFDSLPTQLIDLFNYNWKSELIHYFDSLHKPKSQNDSINDALEFIRSNEIFDEILFVANSLIKKYPDTFYNRETIIKIKRILRSPLYNQVLIVTGAAGSWRSNFINYFQKECVKQIETNGGSIIPLFLKPVYIELSSFEEYIVSEINTFLGVNSLSINEIAVYLKEENFIICFCMDDLNLLVHSKDDWNSIITTIKNFSKYCVFRWVFSINIFEYFNLEYDDTFITRYCIQQEVLLNKVKLAYSSFFKYALNLDDYNNERRIIDRILKNAYNLEFSNIPIDIHKGIATPTEAILFVENVVSPDIWSFPTTYFEYAKSLTKWKSNVLLTTKSKTITSTVITIIDAFTKSKSSKVNFNLESDEDIIILRNIQLISQEATTNDNPFSIEQSSSIITYSLQTIVYWCMKAIGYYYENNNFDQQELLLFDNEIQEWLIPCYIFYNYNNIEQTKEFYDILNNNELLNYVLFCVQRSKIEFARTTLLYLIEHPSIIETDKNCYALLYYIYYSPIKISQKLALCNILAPYIEKYKMFQMYEFVLKSVLLTSTKGKKLKKNLLEIVDCKIASINHINGYTSADVFVDLLSDNKNNLSSVVKEIVYWCQKNPLLKAQIADGSNNSFMDFFMRRCFEQFIDSNTNLEQIYDELTEIFEIEYPFGSFVKRNLTCAAGNYFSNCTSLNDKYTKMYIAFVESLYCSGSSKNLTTVWFLISNSVDEKSLASIGLNPELKNILKKLKKNQDIYDRYREQMDKLLMA